MLSHFLIIGNGATRALLSLRSALISTVKSRLFSNIYSETKLRTSVFLQGLSRRWRSSWGNEGEAQEIVDWAFVSLVRSVSASGEQICESLIKSPWAQILSALRVAKCYIITTGGMVSIVLWKLLERHWLLCWVKRTAWFRSLDAKSPHLLSTEPRSLESPISHRQRNRKI